MNSRDAAQLPRQKAKKPCAHPHIVNEDPGPYGQWSGDWCAFNAARRGRAPTFPKTPATDHKSEPTLHARGILATPPLDLLDIAQAQASAAERNRDDAQKQTQLAIAAFLAGAA